MSRLPLKFFYGIYYNRESVIYAKIKIWILFIYYRTFDILSRYIIRLSIYELNGSKDANSGLEKTFIIIINYYAIFLK